MVFHSKDDQWVLFEAGVENANGLSAKTYFFNNRNHFGKIIGEFPELLNEILD
ncbi:hypothetical protein J4416_02390 [Candidatus Pacearchaeota archaeon]|nr:hypothetical protein [Candidatus Pacearchaeota archaeon]